jgi:hypothetical protein
MEDLFVPYTEGDRYMKREQQALYEIFGSIISSFLRTMVGFGDCVNND